MSAPRITLDPAEILPGRNAILQFRQRGEAPPQERLSVNPESFLEGAHGGIPTLRPLGPTGYHEINANAGLNASPWINQGRTMDLAIETDREDDGRWIADIPALPGVMCYGDSRESVLVNVHVLALKAIADAVEHGAMEVHSVIRFLEPDPA